jgi:DNA mismatch repair protein MutS2
LLDELGAGTEPHQGAAIACSVLHELQSKGAKVIATTHLSEIIGFVHRSPGMFNAGMEYDSATYTPLYRLICGEPGHSHALDIAGRFGMPERSYMPANCSVRQVRSFISSGRTAP